MKEISRKVWYAVNGRGRGMIFTTKPERNEHFKVWEGEQIAFISNLILDMEVEGFELPDTKFDDDPVELIVSVKYG